MYDLYADVQADEAAAGRANRKYGELESVKPLLVGTVGAFLQAFLVAGPPLLYGVPFSWTSIVLVVVLSLAAAIEATVSSPDGGPAPPLAIASALALLGAFWLALLGSRETGYLVMGAGMFLLIGGITLRVLAIRALGTRFISAHRAELFVCGGIYGRLRHPSETGQLMLGLGAALLMGSFGALCWVALLMVPLTLRRLRHEETVLLRIPGYSAYRGQVPGLIPRLTRGKQ
jgi:protein-S-isoprenylcysteine O-methyltransferase Ste14